MVDAQQLSEAGRSAYDADVNNVYRMQMGGATHTSSLNANAPSGGAQSPMMNRTGMSNMQKQQTQQMQ